MSAYASSPSHLRAVAPNPNEPGLIDVLVAQIADQVADRLVQQLSAVPNGSDDWLDSRQAAEYLGVHRDTLRKLAAERSIPSEQDGPHCKLYFRRSDLDAWRQGGGRPHHPALAA